MVRQCQVCGKMDTFNPELSFHRFPMNMERRKIWFSLVGIHENQRLPKFPEICSSHFNPIIQRENGLRFVRPGANPKPIDLLYFEATAYSSDSSIYQTPPKKISTKLEFDDSECPAGPSKISHENIQQTGEQGSSYSSPSNTASASETEHEIKRLCLVSQTKSSTKILHKRKRYVGDLGSSDFSNPEKRRRNLSYVKNTVVMQRKRIHHLQMTVRRLRMRITNLQSLLTYLKEKSLISESSESVIKASLSGPAADIFERLLKGPSAEKYNPILRSFALTLSFYSPKAYNFVRETFNKTLPHMGTISKWYRSVNGSPGFTKEALTALTLKQNKASGSILCNLVMDEMSIRRQVEWTGKKFTGYIDIGTGIDEDTLPEAREVLVFMLVALNDSWKVPIGYFLINGLPASTKADLVIKCLDFIHESGVTITSITFDGAPTNITMAEKLGADFSSPKILKPFFKHPRTNAEVYIFLDPCHMIKLVRNCIASQTQLRDSSNREIKWEFLSALVSKQNLEGLQAATKLRRRHLEWAREKMRVRLATQTISKSVSDALTFLRDDLKVQQFKDSEATSEFLLKFNNLFDIFNSRNRFAKYCYKQPFSPKTYKDFFEFLDNMKEYINGLSLKGVPIIKSSRKTGFLGFLICLESLQNMYKQFVITKQSLKYILSYKLSQEHLELFFGAIRSKGGYNNNPTARQFEAAYKRLLVHSQIRASDSGNAINLENITILTCGSGNLTRTETCDNLEESSEYFGILENIKNNIESNYNSSSAWDLTLFVEDVVGYISGFVVKSVKKMYQLSYMYFFVGK